MSREKEDLSEKVVDAVEEIEEEERIDDVITLSSGVKIKVKPVNKQFLYQALEKFEPPKPPRVLIEGKGKDRYEENPNDPDYLDAVEKFTIETSVVINDITLLRGIEIIEIPEDIEDSESEFWKDEMEILGLSTDNKRYRWLSWFKAIAVPNDEELNIVMEMIGRLTGITEGSVAEAFKSFRRLEGGQEDRSGDDMD